jgi:ribosomal protein S18 acetylase RimI-like enzyme
MFTVRRATLKDCPGIAKTQVDSYRTAYAGLFPQPYLDHFTYEEEEQDWRDLLSADLDDILLVAVSPEDQVLGYVLARANPDSYPGYDAEVIALHVNRSQQGEGIGKALMRSAVEQLIERNCQSVMLWTLKENKVRTWYAQLDGQLIAEKSQQVNDWVVYEVAYGWKNIIHLITKLKG